MSNDNNDNKGNQGGEQKGVSQGGQQAGGKTTAAAHDGQPTARGREMGRDGDPLGDLAQDGKTWTPPPGEQGMSNRPDDE